MKRLFLIAAAALFFAATLTSCNSCENKEQKDQEIDTTIQWNVSTYADGDGYISFNFPTGKASLDGCAEMNFCSMHNVDTVFMAENALTCEEILSEEGEEFPEYLKDAAELINSSFNVDSMYGKWCVDVNVYARVGKFNIKYKKHWPEADTTVVLKEVFPHSRDFSRE